MTLFILLSLVLAVASLAILVARRPVAAHVTDPATAAIAATRPSRGLVLALGSTIAVVAIGGYAWIGSPRLIAVTPDAAPGPGPAMEAQVDTLQARAEAHPTDPRGWMQAAQMQVAANHLEAAAQDMRNALAQRPQDADLMAELADLVASTQHQLDGEPIQLVDRALAINPNQVKALALKGQYAITQRDFRTMLTAWSHAIDVAQPGDPIAELLKRRLDALRDAAAAANGGAASGPGAR